MEGLGHHSGGVVDDAGDGDLAVARGGSSAEEIPGRKSGARNVGAQRVIGHGRAKGRVVRTRGKGGKGSKVPEDLGKLLGVAQPFLRSEAEAGESRYGVDVESAGHGSAADGPT
jgi:hypothetical protein